MSRTRGLDPHIAREIRGIVTALAKQGVTVFLTTHYMEEADQLSQRVAFIDRGKDRSPGYARTTQRPLTAMANRSPWKMSSSSSPVRS